MWSSVIITAIVAVAGNMVEADSAFSAPPLNITALTSQSGYSVMECWQLAMNPVNAMKAANYKIGETESATWSRIEPRTDVGEAWAPRMQCVYLLSPIIPFTCKAVLISHRLSMILNGLIRITSPAPASSGNSDSLGKMQETGVDGDGLPVIASNSSSSKDDQDGPKTHMAYIMPGTLKSSVLIAADLKNMSTIRGHYTEFPSDEPTLLVQTPFENDELPEYTVLHDGPCV